MKKLLIIDGHSLLFQMFYGMPARIVGREGKSVHAAVGFIGAILKAVGILSPTHIAVIFDGENGSFRSLESEEYKSNRTDFTDAPDCENPFSQLGYIRRALDTVGIRNYEISESFEADDMIAAYTGKYGNEFEIYIMSSDRDFFQLVSDNVKVFVYRGKSSVIYDTDRVFAKYGVLPKYIADHKALTGDASDSVSGIRGIGPKTASALITEFGGIEDIISRAESIKKPSVRKAILENERKIRENYRLIKLSHTVELPFGAEDMEISDLSGEKTMEILRRAEII